MGCFPGQCASCRSLSARRAWIEIRYILRQYARHSVALRKESVDRNSTASLISHPPAKSLSARRAWIEMAQRLRPGACPPSLSARRAWIEIARHTAHACGVVVALRKESVDRNPEDLGAQTSRYVALRKESVDRNIGVDAFFTVKDMSLSARRAWIEIDTGRGGCAAARVALRKESVDRNNEVMK